MVAALSLAALLHAAVLSVETSSCAQVTLDGAGFTSQLALELAPEDVLRVGCQAPPHLRVGASCDRPSGAYDLRFTDAAGAEPSERRVDLADVEASLRARTLAVAAAETWRSIEARRRSGAVATATSADRARAGSASRARGPAAVSGGAAAGEGARASTSRAGDAGAPSRAGEPTGAPSGAASGEAGVVAASLGAGAATGGRASPAPSDAGAGQARGAEVVAGAPSAAALRPSSPGAPSLAEAPRASAVEPPGPASPPASAPLAAALAPPAHPSSGAADAAGTPLRGPPPAPSALPMAAPRRPIAAPGADARLRLGLSAAARLYPTHDTALVGARIGAALSLTSWLDLGLDLDALTGGTSAPLGDVGLIALEAAVGARARLDLGAAQLILGPRLAAGWAHASGDATGNATGGSGDTATLAVGVVAGAEVALGGRVALGLEADVGAVVHGLAAYAGDQVVAAIDGLALGAALTLAWRP